MKGAVQWIPAVIFCVCGAGALWIEHEVLRSFLANAAPYILACFTGAALYAGARCCSRLGSLLSGTRDWTAFLVLLAAGFALLLTTVPRTNRILYDEFIYQSVAQNIHSNFQAALSDWADAESGGLEAKTSSYNKQPPAFPFILALFYAVLGQGENCSFFVNALMYAFGAAGLFVLSKMLLKNLRLALLATALFAFSPTVLIWSNTVAVEPAAAAFSIWCLVAARMYAAAPARITAVFLGSMLGAASLFRAESPLIVLCCGVIIDLYIDRSINRTRWPLLAAIFIAALFPAFLHLLAVRHESWGSDSEMISFRHVFTNAYVNGAYWLNNKGYPSVWGVLALVGLASPGWRKERVTILAWLVCSCAIFLFFYAGSYGYGADIRFALLATGPVSIAAAIGLHRLSLWLGKKALVAALLLMFANWLLFLPAIRTVGTEGAPARADVSAAREFARRIPEDALVLAFNPTMFQVWKKNAAAVSPINVPASAALRSYAAQYPGGLYFYWDYWCNQKEYQPVCHRILSRLRSTVIAERKIKRYRFAMMRAEPK